MKTLKFLLVVLFVVLSSVALSQEGLSPEALQPDKPKGGVVYTDGKQIVYQSFAGKKQVLWSSDKSAVRSLDVTPDGKILVVLDNNYKLWTKTLPSGEFCLINVSLPVDSKERNIGNIKASIKTYKQFLLSFEAKKTDLALVEVPGDSKAHLKRVKFPLRLTKDEREQYPAYLTSSKSYNSVTAFFAEVLYYKKQRVLNFGNPAWFPAQFPYLDVNKSGKETLIREIVHGKEMFTALDPRWAYAREHYDGYRDFLTLKDAQRCFGVTRSALFPVWHPKLTWLAVIYQTKDGWGPIEVRNCNYETNTHLPAKGDLEQKKQAGVMHRDPAQQDFSYKPQKWDLLFSSLLQNCRGLAWKPDGSLSVLAEDKVLVIDYNQIASGVKNSTLQYDDLGRLYQVRDSFEVAPMLVAGGINGDSLSWISNDSFVFRGEDSSIYCWNQSQVTKLLDFIPQEFSYCSPGTFDEASGVDTVQEYARFSVGSILTSSEGSADSSVIIYTMNYLKNGDLQNCQIEYALLKNEKDIEEIKNPSQYLYKKSVAETEFKRAASRGECIVPSVRVALNQIILLKDGNKYAAIKPLGLEGKTIPILRSGQKGVPRWESLTFQWKYWPKWPPDQE